MDFPLPSLVAALAATFLLVTFLHKLFRSKEVTPKIPEPGFAWPIIGHYFYLLAANNWLPHKVLGDLADKYGPMFRMRLGAHQVLVVSDSQTAKECLNTNDRALAGRPKAIASEHIGYNYANFGFAPNTPFWRDVRKVVVVELLSNRRVEALRRFRESAAKTFIQDIYRTWEKNKNESNVVKVDMKEWFGKLIIDSMLHLLFGHRYEEVGSWVKAVFRRNFELLGMSLMGDYLPWLRWLDIGGYEKAIKENTKEMDRVMEDWLQEHKKNTNVKPEGEQDFMGALLSQISSNQDILNGFDSDTVVKATCSALLAASTDSTSSTLTWALSLILNSDKVLETIRTELDNNVGIERHVNESDLNNLTYLHAVVKETLRLYPPGPLLMPHECVEDCVINGYRILKGTRILINASKIHRDSNFWSNPDAFNPERFLAEYKEIDMKGKTFELIPFGSGRRICPGMSLSLQTVQLGLAAIIHGFDIKRASDEPIDMTEANGLAVGKATPLQVLLTPRLPSHLYH